MRKVAPVDLVHDPVVGGVGDEDLAFHHAVEGGPRVLQSRPTDGTRPADGRRTQQPPARAHERDIREQISNLGKLQDGWLDGTGKACDPEELANLAERLVRHYPLDAPELRLYPTGDGNVQAEWWIGNYSAVLEIFLDGTAAAEWSDCNIETKQENARLVNIDDEQDWEWVVQRLQSLS